jgi:hypothetical protein
MWERKIPDYKKPAGCFVKHPAVGCFSVEVEDQDVGGTATPSINAD